MVQPPDAPLTSPLLSAADVRRLADELDLRPTKQWGQNFVIDPNTIRRIVQAAEVAPDEHVLEIGPGLGSLTLGLLDAARAVTALEIDPVTAARLPQTVAEYRPERADALSVVHADALQLTAAQLEASRPAAAEDGPTALVANLPYNVAVPVLLHALAELPTLRHGLVMVQEEVADRLAAPPGSRTYGIPSAKAAWYADVRKAGVIGTQVFWPAPRIHSGLVAFTRREPPTQAVGRVEVFAVVDAAFAQRRKTLRAALAGWAGSAPRAEEALAAAGIDPRERGEALDIASFARIAEHGPAPQAAAASSGASPTDEAA